MRKRNRGGHKAAKGGNSHFTARHWYAEPVSDGMCRFSVQCLSALVVLLQVILPLPPAKLAVAGLIVVGYSVAVFYVKAFWRQEVAP